MAPGRRGGQPGGSRIASANSSNGRGRGARGRGRGGRGGSNIRSLHNVFSIDDEEENKALTRRKHNLDEVDNYEYHVDAIDEEDDEEIDSDEAFDEDDEERFENFQFYGSKDRQKKLTKKKAASSAKDKGKADSDEEEMMSAGSEDEEDDEEEEEEEEEGAEYMDLSEMLDQPQSDEEPVKLPKKVKLAGFNDSESEEDELMSGDEADQVDEEDESEDEEDEDEDEEDEDKTDNLTSFIDSLETTTKKRKQEDAGQDGSKKARKNLRERTEAYDESEYNLQAHRASAGNKKKLDLMDLVSTFQDEAGFSSLKKNIQALESGNKKGKAVETLAAPLPKIVQDRLNREAAYTEASKEVSKWLPIVQKNRQADHLAFPLNAPGPESQSSASLASDFHASTEMEKEVESVLVAGGMQEKSLMKFEELSLNKMSVEEVEKRRAELRMMRELMFRDELRAKRVSKIKSKMYRKIKKKERERHALSASEMAELDPYQLQEEQIKAEQQRAIERMTLKHKNTSKWAKEQLRHNQHDPESRQAIMEQLDRGERLRRKIQGVDSDEEQSGGESEYSDLDDDDVAGVKARAFDELAQVEEQLARQEDAAKEAKVGKGIFAMKFMQEAAKRSKLAAQQAAEEFREQMMEEEALANMSSDDEWTSVGKAGKKGKKAKEQVEPVKVSANGGRMVFGTGAASSDATQEDSKTSKKKDVSLNSAGQIDKVALSGGHSTKVAGPVNVNVGTKKAAAAAAAGDSSDEDGTSNPWLKQDKHNQGKIARKKGVDITKDSSKVDKLQAKVKKHKAAEAVSDDDVEIDTQSFLTLSKDNQIERGLNQPDAPAQEDSQAKGKKAKKANAAAAAAAAATPTKDSTAADEHDADDDDDDSENEAPAIVHKSAARLSQRELVARAFAHDDVVADFAKEKAEIAEEDRPKDVDMTLPGWGSWGGKGTKKKKNVVVKKAKPGEGVDISKRKDAKLAHVIINEKRDKKAAAYNLTKLPHPFTTWEQYEQSLRTPVGKEWNTNATFQKLTLPRITTKVGQIIDPLTAPFK
ncbi:hypothetical protein BGW41_007795 [Actinomortierella wolfii]|nr:hypothetical protein BGW41_007795 [Actinomortierella wolfii]